MNSKCSICFILFLYVGVSMALSANVSIIPNPSECQIKPGYFKLTSQTVIVADEPLRPIAELWCKTLNTAMGFDLKILPAADQQKGIMNLQIQPDMKELGKEGYLLQVAPEQVRLQACDQAGIFYGLITIKQLLAPEIFSRGRASHIDWTIQCLEIQDRPRFNWRGMHLDVCRHFMPIEFVKKYIDLIALHKMNIFHWHLTDDQGWRIEIKKYPKLTEIGGWRKETLIGPMRKQPREFDATPHGGFYTQEEIRDVVEYARRRFVTIVPEIEMPGHTQAAIAAYPELGTTGLPTETLTYWGGCEQILNAEESTVRFMQDVLEGVLDLFPGPYIHIGADEVNKQPWKDSPQVQARMKELALDNEEQLQSWFVRQMDTFLTERGRRLIGWDEILEGGLAPGATVMSWRGMEGGLAAAKSGHDVVMAPCLYTYFDYYQADPDIEPLAIGGFTPLEKVYSFDPIPEGLSPDQARHILGAQGQVWTEYISTPDKVEYMALPRMSALAEVVWSRQKKKDFSEFQSRLLTHMKRLKYWGVNFRQPE